MDKTQNKLIVALDFPCWEAAERLVQKLPAVKFFKVGLELYLASGGQAVERLAAMGKEVFLDLKFHDIPNTVAGACRQAVAKNTAMFNLHASGGLEMMTAAARAVNEEAARLEIRRPLVLAVTVLTSMNEAALQEIGMKETNPAQTVARLAALAQKAGLDGVVASPQEIGIIRETCREDFKIVCPGIRPAGAETQDQRRILTPGEAVKRGADYLVVGRPITQAENPAEAAAKIMKEMEEALLD